MRRGLKGGRSFLFDPTMQSSASGRRSPEIEEESPVRAPAAAILSRRDTRKKVTYNEEVLAANELERDNKDTII